MTTSKISGIAKLAAAVGLAVALSGAAQADVRVSDQAAVKVGMNQDEVQRALGKPSKVENYSLSDTSTWIYRSADQFAQPGDKVFDVDFGADGKVKSSGIRLLNDPGHTYY